MRGQDRGRACGKAFLQLNERPDHEYVRIEVDHLLARMAVEQRQKREWLERGVELGDVVAIGHGGHVGHAQLRRRDDLERKAAGVEAGWIVREDGVEASVRMELREALVQCEDEAEEVTRRDRERDHSGTRLGRQRLGAADRARRGRADEIEHRLHAFRRRVHGVRSPRPQQPVFDQRLP